MTIPRAKALRPRNLRVAAALTIVCLFIAGCGNGGGSGAIKAGPGVDLTKKTITLGVLTPLSGPVAAPIGIPLTKGIETYFDAVNANGGVDGFQIKLVEKDSQYNPQLQVEAYNEIHNQVLMLAESLGSPTTSAIKDLATRDQMLVSAATLDSYLAREKYMVMVGTPYRLQVENAFDYVVNKLGVQNPKTGIIYQDDAYGQDGLTGYKEAVTAYHLNDVGQATYEATDTTFTAPVSQMKAAGAQYVFLTAIPTAAAGIIGTAHALGYDPHWILQSPAFATGLMAVPGLNQLLEAEAWVVGQGALWGDRSQPGMAEMLDNIAKYAPGQQPDGYFQFCYTEAKITYAILKKAADNKDLTRAGLLTAFDSLKQVDLGGLLPPVTYGSASNDRVPSRDSRIYAIDPTQPGDVKDLSGDFVGTAAAASQF
ncbi:MAG TPA: ABC transporter substrate-binding protein [Ktedonobacterales bacterium]|nr:ABC transporter substrate-binding protein [Ktedonobacterales bacterium]